MIEAVIHGVTVQTIKAIVLSVAIGALLGIGVFVGLPYAYSKIFPHKAPVVPAVMCAGDSMAFRDSAMYVTGSILRYKGVVTNKCRFAATITVRATFSRNDGSTAAQDDFFVLKEGDIVSAGESVSYSRSVRLFDDPKEVKRHVYIIHKYGHVVMVAAEAAEKAE